MPVLLSLSEMAKELGCSTKVFARDVNEKQIPYKPVGKRKKFDPITVHAYLDRLATHTVLPSTPPVKIAGKRGRFAEVLGL